MERFIDSGSETGRAGRPRTAGPSAASPDRRAHRTRVLPDLADRLEARARSAVREVVAEDGELIDVPVEVRAVCGAPGKVLVEESGNATELVLGHRALGGSTSALLGSVGL